MLPDTKLYQDVISEFIWDDQLKPNELGISVKGGVVILTGITDSYGNKSTAEQVAKRVAGVRGVVNNIQVHLPTSGEYTDTYIACAAVQALAQCTSLIHDRVKVVVCNGWITLEGEVDRYDQCDDAEEAVRELIGMTGITNLIVVRPNVLPEYIKARIEEGLIHSAAIDAQQIAVEVCGSNVMLRGQVRSWAERTEAWYVAWRAPGVTSVRNQIEVALLNTR
jgi:osmotically-inducible protein OsmY